MALGCGTHQAVVMTRGAESIVGELAPIVKVDWNRIRDDISLANVWVGAGQCDDWLGDIRSGGEHELHIFRDGVPVWEGPVTRLEYRRGYVEIYASDILWVAKNTALSKGYSHKHPNVAACGWVMNRLLRDLTFAKYGDPWNARDHVLWLKGPDEPKTTKVVPAWSTTTWEDFDKFAEDSGMDYTVFGRDIMFWDTHYRWMQLPDLQETYLTQGLAVVEYGNEFATRVVVTNGKGQAGIAAAPAWALRKYGHIDHVVTAWNEAAGEVATPEELSAWTEQAKGILRQSFPAPTRVRVSDGTGLRPDSPYEINDLVAGAFLNVTTTSLQRQMTELHKLHSVSVRQEGAIETVAITTIAAPLEVVG